MPSVAVYNSEGQEIKQIELSPSIFDEEINLHSVRAAINRQLARKRQGNAATKTRGMVRASNAKPWAQKGTGRARAGRTSSPIWRGGGTVFGPHPHKYGGRLNRKVTRNAIVSCLTSLAAAEREIIVIDDIQLSEPKTRQVIDLLAKLKIEANRVLFLTDVTNVNLALSARNIPYVDVINCDNINTYDLTTHDVLIATMSAIERLEEVYST